MNIQTLTTESYFDGTRFHTDGPYTLTMRDGVIREIWSGGAEPIVPFLMPGLVEAHAHLFLDGDELNQQVRADYLKAPRAEMLAVARRNVAANLAAGITLVRDAGDIHGINTQIKAECATRSDVVPAICSAGRALRKAKRYGSFMAVETTDRDSIVQTIRQLAPQADQLKILLTGIIDFENGTMKGGVQFDLEETKLIVQTAHELGLRTFAHCSGADGLRIALAAGIDCIEHGFFMEPEFVRQMAEAGTAWVPTFLPVYFQYDQPQHCGWNAATVAKLWTILERHFAMIGLAGQLGVPVLTGSDAGSYGVPHGRGLIEELFLLRRAGLPVEKVLAAATCAPRQHWGYPSAEIAPGNRADMVARLCSSASISTTTAGVGRSCTDRGVFVPGRRRGKVVLIRAGGETRTLTGGVLSAVPLPLGYAGPLSFRVVVTPAV